MIPIFDIRAVRASLFADRLRARANLSRLHYLSRILNKGFNTLEKVDSQKKFQYELYYSVGDIDFDNDDWDCNPDDSFDTILPAAIFGKPTEYSTMYSGYGARYRHGKDGYVKGNDPSLKVFTSRISSHDYVYYPDGREYGPEILATFSSDYDLYDYVVETQLQMPNWINDWRDMKGREALGIKEVYDLTFQSWQETPPGSDDYECIDTDFSVEISYWLLDVTGVSRPNPGMPT